MVPRRHGYNIDLTNSAVIHRVEKEVADARDGTELFTFEKVGKLLIGVLNTMPPLLICEIGKPPQFDTPVRAGVGCAGTDNGIEKCN